MIEEREIWACANLLLSQHGTAARAHPQRRAQALDEAGDQAGQATFLRIAERIKDLQEFAAPGPTH